MIKKNSAEGGSAFGGKNEIDSLPEMDTVSMKEKYAIMTGIILIVFVLVFTLLRSLDWTKETTIGSDGSDQAVALDYDSISSKDLRQHMITNDKLVVLDIRSFDDYIKEHILDSVNVPAAEIANTVKIKPADELVIIGSNAQDSSISAAVSTLKSNHYTNYKVLAGGMAAWQANDGSTVSFGDPTSFTDQAKVFYADMQQAHDLLINDPAHTAAIDVRDPSLFAQGHVPGAINIPLLDIERRRKDVPLFKKILVFGTNEVEEFQAAVQLHDIMMIPAYVTKGAMQKWQDMKFDIAQ